MTTLHYNILTGTNGSVLIPTTPFATGEEIEVVLTGKYRAPQPLDDGWRPDPAAVRQFMEYVESLPPVEITDEEIEQLKHERRMRKML